MGLVNYLYRGYNPVTKYRQDIPVSSIFNRKCSISNPGQLSGSSQSNTNPKYMAAPSKQIIANLSFGGPGCPGLMLFWNPVNSPVEVGSLSIHYLHWLVVSTPSKNMSQNGNLAPKVRDQNLKIFQTTNPSSPSWTRSLVWFQRFFVGRFGRFWGFGFILQGFFFSSPKISENVYISWKMKVFFWRSAHWPGIVTIANGYENKHIWKRSYFFRGSSCSVFAGCSS